MMSRLFLLIGLVAVALVGLVLSLAVVGLFARSFAAGEITLLFGLSPVTAVGGTLAIAMTGPVLLLADRFRASQMPLGDWINAWLDGADL